MVRRNAVAAEINCTMPLEAYGMIGDGETAALVSRNGSIDWLCLPRFDSPACCAALLGTHQHGHWTIAPEDTITNSEHRYRPDTLVLETDLTTDTGAIRITDFMTVRSGPPVLIRMVTGLSGEVRTRLEAAFRFDYGDMPPWVTRTSKGAAMQVGADKAFLHATEALVVVDNSLIAHFEVNQHSRHIFALIYGEDNASLDLDDADSLLEATEKFWRGWISRFDHPVLYGSAVRRSLLTLKALIHRPTGGLIAAPTTSLPEQPGGAMNWDYRYCWLRDATFTLSALLECGYVEEATAWRDWILRAVAGAPDRMQIMYRVDGSRRLDETELSWLPGYRFARPVRIGNAAAGQLQLDVYGELIRALHASERAGMSRTEQGRHLEHAIVDHVLRIWSQPDHGLWESRGEPRHYVYSKVMAWAAVHRFLEGEGGDELADDERNNMHRMRDHIHEVICREAFNIGLGSFTSYFGSDDVDASLLLLPRVGFLPVDDGRMAGTISRIERTLVVDGLVRRHLLSDFVPEGAFIACSFWLADCQLEQGRREDAIKTIERALSVRSELGLLAEEFDVSGGRLAGNYPQALSHLALIHTLLKLNKSGQPHGNLTSARCQ